MTIDTVVLTSVVASSAALVSGGTACNSQINKSKEHKLLSYLNKAQK